MPSIDIRPVVANDISTLQAFNHGCEITHTWQMDSSTEESQIDVSFHKIRLPRPVKLAYHHNPDKLSETWKRFDLFLVGRIEDQYCGYLTLKLDGKQKGRIIDLVVDEPYRRQGVASALLVAAQDWLRVNGFHQVILEMQIKNLAAISLAEKMGYVFCGYMDQYFGSHEIAIFYMNYL